MSETERPDIDDMHARLEDLRREIEAFEEETLSPMVDAFGEAMSRIGGVMSREIEQAVTTGRFAVKDMVADMLSSLAELGAQRLVGAPVQAALHGVLDGVFGGARASGGPVAPGTSYLVGERGPEIFTPQSAGGIGAPQTSVTVNLTVPSSSAPSFARSEAQLAGLLARAVGKAVRNG